MVSRTSVTGLAQRAEAALFDSIFLADQLALGEDVAQAARTWLEPITVLAVLHRRDPFDPTTRRVMHRSQIRGNERIA